MATQPDEHCELGGTLIPVIDVHMTEMIGHQQHVFLTLLPWTAMYRHVGCTLCKGFWLREWVREEIQAMFSYYLKEEIPFANLHKYTLFTHS